MSDVSLENLLEADQSQLDADRFEEYLQETAAWLDYKLEEDRDLTYPGTTWDVPDFVKDLGGELGDRPHTRRQRHVTHVRMQRRDAYNEIDHEPPSQLDGRILVTYIDRSLSDGAAEVTSNEFFSRSNIPPTDTWIAYLRLGRRPDGDEIRDVPDYWEEGVLLSYVPSELERRVQNGIDVNPEECIQFAAETG